MIGVKFLKKIQINPFLCSVIILFIFACSNEKDNKKNPITIKNINVTQAVNRTPKESDYQVDLALTGVMSDANINQDIQYDWTVEYLKMDIQSEASLNKDAVSQQTPPNANKNYLKGCYFLDISKDPLNTMLSVYKPGYYKVTLQASNADETKEYPIIIKAGEIDYPTLFVKLNVPDSDLNNRADNLKGKFFINVANNVNGSNTLEVDAANLKNGWYDTKLTIDPFASFTINAGTHIVNGSASISSINGNFNYYFNPDKKNPVTSSPIVLKNIDEAGPIFISNSDGKWQNGEIYASFLLWNTNSGNKDQFSYFEKVLNNDTGAISADLNNAYIAKIFIGSLGIKSLAGKYFVYFGPEGTDVEELDPKNLRDFTGVPYGCLLGRLNSDGNPFQIGNSFIYSYNKKIAVYSQDASGNFSME